MTSKQFCHIIFGFLMMMEIWNIIFEFDKKYMLYFSETWKNFVRIY
jgi:hypothetical protein